MATSTLGSGTLVLAGTTSGTTTVTATAVAGTTTLTLPAATDTLVGKATTDTLTNKTLTGAAMNGTLGATTPSTVAATTLTTSSTVTHNGGTANGVGYLDGSKVLTTGSALVFDGTNFGVGVTPSAWSQGKAIEVLEKGYGFWNGTSSSYILANAYYNGGFKYGGTGQASYYYQYQGAHVWSTAASGTAGNAITFTQAMTLDASGNLGIGTSSPAFKLDVNSGATASTARLETTAATAYSAGSFFTGANLTIRSGANATGNGSGIRFTSNANGNIEGLFGFVQNSSTYGDFVWQSFNGSYGERMRLDSSGNLLVGTTNSSSSAGNGFKINPNGITTGVPQISIVGNNADNNNGTYSIYSSSLSQYQFYVGYGGTVYARSTSITGLSDQREKENIRTLDVGLNEVLALQPRRFDWKDGSTLNVAGFVAQEVQQVLPDLIEQYKINDEETRLGLKMGDMIPTLVKAIQEQQALITQLTARITALESA